MDKIYCLLRQWYEIESAYDRIVKPASVRLTFVGSENHYPNQDAVDWFCHEVAPCLRVQGFKFVFQVIGTWKSRYVKKSSGSMSGNGVSGLCGGFAGILEWEYRSGANSYW